MTDLRYRNLTGYEQLLNRTAEIRDGIDTFVGISHQSSRDAGWYHNLDGSPKERNVPEMIALCHSELSEALEGFRKNLMDDHLPHRKSVEVELADLLIRVGDLAGFLQLNLGRAVVEKMIFNAHREDHKLENRMKEGGKAF